MSQKEGTVDLFTALARGWRWILALAVVLAIAGGAAGVVLPKTYEATTLLTLDTTGGRTLNMETEVLVVTSTTVLSRVAEELGEERVGPIRGAVSVQVPRGSNALEITARTDDPDRSAEIANGVAEAYGDHRQEATATSRGAQLEALEDRITTLERRLSDEDPDSARTSAIQSQLSTAELQLLELQLQGDNGASSRGTVVTPATAPASPANPGMLLLAAAGGMGGILLGLAVSLVRARLSTPETG